MDNVPGTKGYEKVVKQFVEASQALDFDVVNKDFLNFIPQLASRILDAGSGSGQNAAALAQLGHSVIAVEPFTPFLDAARSTYRNLSITWIEDSLPLLKKLGNTPSQFDFILVDGVWHHLGEKERMQGMARFSSLLCEGGCCALSLRHGPAGAGKHVFPTNGKRTAALAYQYGLEVVLYLTNQPSLMKNKPGVTWTRMVLRKQNPL
ncbi:MAG: class I SAM-dependent methyltransferase [Cyanobacteria bacterium P01_A01_bin.68]